MGPPELVYVCPDCGYTLRRGFCLECGYPQSRVEPTRRLAVVLKRAASAIWITFAVFILVAVLESVFEPSIPWSGLVFVFAMMVALPVSLAYVFVRWPARSLVGSVTGSVGATMLVASGLLTLVEVLNVDLKSTGPYHWVLHVVARSMWVVPSVLLAWRIGRLAGTDGQWAHGFAIVLKVVACLMIVALIPPSSTPTPSALPQPGFGSSAGSILFYSLIFAPLAWLVARRLNREVGGEQRASA